MHKVQIECHGTLCYTIDTSCVGLEVRPVTDLTGGSVTVNATVKSDLTSMQGRTEALCKHIHVDIIIYVKGVCLLSAGTRAPVQF